MRSAALGAPGITANLARSLKCQQISALQISKMVRELNDLHTQETHSLCQSLVRLGVSTKWATTECHFFNVLGIFNINTFCPYLYLNLM